MTKTCSFTVKGPGFNLAPKMDQLGRNAAAALPIGNDNNCATIPVMVTEGYRKKKNWFKPGMRMAQTRPITQDRRVATGMVGSSVLATADRTSGYGLSSSKAKCSLPRLGSSNPAPAESLQVEYELPRKCR